MPKMVYFGAFWKPEACGQTVLPDRSVLIRQKLVESAKIQKYKLDILGDFQTLCSVFQKNWLDVWLLGPLGYWMTPISLDCGQVITRSWAKSKWLLASLITHWPKLWAAFHIYQ